MQVVGSCCCQIGLGLNYLSRDPFYQSLYEELRREPSLGTRLPGATTSYHYWTSNIRIPIQGNNQPVAVRVRGIDRKGRSFVIEKNIDASTL